jgi:hypothetical protein
VQQLPAACGRSENDPPFPKPRIVCDARCDGRALNARVQVGGLALPSMRVPRRHSAGRNHHAARRFRAESRRSICAEGSSLLFDLLGGGFPWGPCMPSRPLPSQNVGGRFPSPRLRSHLRTGVRKVEGQTHELNPERRPSPSLTASLGRPQSRPDRFTLGQPSSGT